MRRIALLESGNSHAPVANPTRVLHILSPSNDNAAMKDEDAHAPRVANPAHVWRVPSPSDNDIDDNRNESKEAPLQTAFAAAKGKRYTLRKISVVRDLRTSGHSITSPGFAE